MRTVNVPVSFVIPCLNEEKTLALVIDAIHSVGHLFLSGYEIIVSDNGSTDMSKQIAESKGARISDAVFKGYGAALLNGINEARYDIVAFADADFTYDFTQAPDLVAKLIDDDCDLILGDRLHGHIEKGAMPFLHRYLGTPVLSCLISVLVAERWGAIPDCNSGFRVFRKEAFNRWQIKSNGMEFASEMLIKAVERKSKIGWVPISLRRDVRGRVPHLKTWRDGMRHLLQILVAAPKFFRSSGILMFVVGLIFFVPSMVIDSMFVGRFSIFGIHTLIFSSFVMFIGMQISSLAYVIDAKTGKLGSSITSMPEDKIFLRSVILSVLSLSVWILIFYNWSKSHYAQLEAQKLAILGLALGLIGFSYVVTLIGIHLIKRT